MMLIARIRRALSAPSPEEKARTELNQAKSSLLDAHSAKEYAQAMVTYHEARIVRLSLYLNRPEVVEEFTL